MSAHTFLKSAFESTKALPSSSETKQKKQRRHPSFSLMALTLLFAIGLPFAAVSLDRIDGAALADAHWVARALANDHWDGAALADAHWVGRALANDHWDRVALANAHWAAAV